MEKKLYEQSILIEEQKQQIASGSGYSNRFKEEEYRLNVEELNKEIQRLLKVFIYIKLIKVILR